MKVQKLKSEKLPLRLQTIPSPSKQINILGNVANLQAEKTVTIVGSRKPTIYGREVTEAIARALTQSGVVIVSGLALGIDSIAHKACLSAGGKTIAVLPSGLDDIYPASHRNLAKQILEADGTLISEYEFGTPALKQNFIARNRLVSALGDIVIVTEAAQKSGTLITAGFALEQGKDVYAVPGNITSPYSAGTNQLIAQGAQVITSPDQLLADLNLDKASARTLSGDNELETRVLSLLAEGVRDGDELQTKLDLTTAEYNQVITIMEITGKIKSLGGNQWTIN